MLLQAAQNEGCNSVSLWLAMCPRVSLLWSLRWDSAESWLPESSAEFPMSFGHLTHNKSDFLLSLCSPMPDEVGSTVSGGFSIHRYLVGLIW